MEKQKGTLTEQEIDAIAEKMSDRLIANMRNQLRGMIQAEAKNSNDDTF